MKYFYCSLNDYSVVVVVAVEKNDGNCCLINKFIPLDVTAFQHLVILSTTFGGRWIR